MRLQGISIRASLVAQLVKNPPAMQETPVHLLGWEDLLEKGQATHSSILPWRIYVFSLSLYIYIFIYSPWDCKESDMSEQLSVHFRNVQACSLFSLSSLVPGKGKKKTSFLFFPFHCNRLPRSLTHDHWRGPERPV